ncbi:DUF4258 domain-containing protein [Candidatus Poribacteria bacterium]|nr:DUF4258 domain-containing protein [Candidatus Poribacteria bacterium]
MSDTRILPDEPLAFIKNCVAQRRIMWTYHVNMRMKKRFIPREMIVNSVETYEIVEAYPEDKYLPSYLVYAEYEGVIIHILFGADVEDKNVRVVTTYRPNPDEWIEGRRRRKGQ